MKPFLILLSGSVLNLIWISTCFIDVSLHTSLLLATLFLCLNNCELLKAGAKSQVSLYHSLAEWLAHEMFKNIYCKKYIKKIKIYIVFNFSVFQFTHFEYLLFAKNYPKRYSFKSILLPWTQQKSIKDIF